jgi:hypothetical protein
LGGGPLRVKRQIDTIALPELAIATIGACWPTTSQLLGARKTTPEVG